MSNIEVAKLLKNIAATYTIKDESKFRFQIIAYQKASDAIEHLNTEIKDLYENDKLDTIPGVGNAIKEYLEELFQTGHVKHFDALTKGIPRSIFPLLEVPTFGAKKAYKLVKELSLKNPETVIDDLEKKAKEGKIAPLKSFGEKSEKDIIRAIEEFKQGRVKKTRMVLPYAYELAHSVVSYLKKSKDVLDVYPLGSLRRMVATVGDVDMAISTESPKKVIDYFTSYPNVERVLEKGEATASILVSSGKQIDLMVQKPESFGSLLQHFTGSKNHNIHLREFALSKGLSLSEYGIKKQGKLLKFETEEKFYGALDMQWIPPELREDNGEIELAIAHDLPKLIELEDIKGDLHTHSDYPFEPSHDLGHSSMKDMVKKALELGYEYIGFSEHNPSISSHSEKEIIKILQKRNKKIEQIKSSNKNIHTINLLEVDILARNKLAIPDESLDSLDAIIVSIHGSFSLSKREMTKRVINGLSHKKAKILGHPTGRLLNQRQGYDLNWDEIFDFCRKNHKALEINAWPNRLDLPDSLVRLAVKHNVKMVINTDSHKENQMELMKYGVSVARRGWAKKSDILNTLPYNEFKEWLSK